MPQPVLGCLAKPFPCGASATDMQVDSGRPSAIRKTRQLTGQSGDFWPQLVSDSATSVAPSRRINPLGVIDAITFFFALGVSIARASGATKRQGVPSDAHFAGRGCRG